MISHDFFDLRRFDMILTWFHMIVYVFNNDLKMNLIWLQIMLKYVNMLLTWSNMIWHGFDVISNDFDMVYHAFTWF